MVYLTSVLLQEVPTPALIADGLEVNSSGPRAVMSTASRLNTAPTPCSQTYPVTVSTIPGSRRVCAAVLGSSGETTGGSKPSPSPCATGIGGSGSPAAS